MAFETIDERKVRKALELHNEYVYLKAVDWLRDNYLREYTEFGFKK